MNISRPQITLRLEGLAIFAAAIFGYAQLGLPWWGFVACLLIPDVAIAFYAINTKVGSVAYNIAHTYTFPLMLLVVGLALGQTPVLAAALIWLAHIGMDRLAGYGLKYTTNFKDTHLARI